MKAELGTVREGFLLVLLGGGLFGASILEGAVSASGPYDLLQSGYVAVAALLIAAGGGWTLSEKWSPHEQRRVVRWAILGGTFLLVLAVLSLFDLRLTTTVAPVEGDFLVLQFTTMGCLGGTTVGVYAVQRSMATRRAVAERDRFSTMVQNTPLPILVTDMDGQVLVWNEAAEETFGYGADAVRGRRLPVVPSGEEAEWEETLARLDSGERIVGLRTKWQRRDGTLLDVELSATVGEDPASEEDTAVIVARDLTEVEIYEQERAVLERVVRHNLRNEMTIIRGYAEQLASGRTEDQQRDALRIRAAADRLTSLSEHVSNVQRRDAPIRSCDVTEVVHEAVEAVRKEYPGASVSLTAPDEARGQAVPLLRDAIREALQNAIVHADAVDTAVSVTVSTEPDTDAVRVSVADTGPGIPDAEWRPIAEGTERPLEHASGLGLWVMQWAVARSGGDLSRADRDPEGTVVTFTLPATLEG